MQRGRDKPKAWHERKLRRSLKRSQLRRARKEGEMRKPERGVIGETRIAQGMATSSLPG